MMLQFIKGLLLPLVCILGNNNNNNNNVHLLPVKNDTVADIYIAQNIWVIELVLVILHS
jgi:hypothetical protein